METVQCDSHTAAVALHGCRRARLANAMTFIRLQMLRIYKRRNFQALRYTEG